MLYSQSKLEAEEVTNDGFMKVFKNFKSYNSSYPVEAWIRRIMINTAIDHYRSQKKHYHQLEINEALDSAEVDVDAIEKMAVDDIMRLVQQLPPSYRVVFTLYTVEGYKHHEIASKLKISEGASKSNLSKAKMKLKQMLMKHQITEKTS